MTPPRAMIVDKNGNVIVPLVEIDTRIRPKSRFADEPLPEGFRIDLGYDGFSHWYFIVKDGQPWDHETGFKSKRNAAKAARKVIKNGQ